MRDETHFKKIPECVLVGFEVLKTITLNDNQGKFERESRGRDKHGP